MIWDYLLIVPLVYALYAFLRLAIDRAVISKMYSDIILTLPDLKELMQDPCSICGAFEWMGSDDPEWAVSDPALLHRYKEIRERLRAWNYRRFPIAVGLAAVFGTLREAMTSN